MPPRDHGESLKEAVEAAEERVGGGGLPEKEGERGRKRGHRFAQPAKTSARGTRGAKRRKVPVDGESKAENPKGSTRLAISLGTVVLSRWLAKRKPNRLYLICCSLSLSLTPPPLSFSDSFAVFATRWCRKLFCLTWSRLREGTIRTIFPRMREETPQFLFLFLLARVCFSLASSRN